jgi:hypothetical protein
MTKQQKQELKDWINACQVEKRADGYYVKIDRLSEFLGPWSNYVTAMRSYRQIFCVE